jgi:hypothetical protein
MFLEADPSGTLKVTALPMATLLMVTSDSLLVFLTWAEAVPQVRGLKRPFLPSKMKLTARDCDGIAFSDTMWAITVQKTH